MGQSFEFEGAVKLVGAVQHSKKGVPFRQIVLEDVGAEYPSTLVGTAWGEKVSDLAGEANEGDVLKASFECNGREYNGKWYAGNKVFRLTAVRKVGKKKGAEPEPAGEAPLEDEPTPF